MDSQQEKIKKILLFQINKSIIGFAKNNIISLEHLKLPREIFEFKRKQILDEANAIVRDLNEIINTAL